MAKYAYMVTVWDVETGAEIAHFPVEVDEWDDGALAETVVLWASDNGLCYDLLDWDAEPM